MKIVILALLFSLQNLLAQTNIITSEEFKALQAKAGSGDADAMFQLGGDYINGQGVPENVTEGLQWIEKAADQGIVEAQMMAGIAYWSGLGVKMDEAKGVKLFRKAAEEGEPGACFYLAAAYDLGKGVKQDYVQSYKWTLVFKASGQSVIPKDAASVDDKLKALASKMTKEDIELAKKLADETIQKLSTKSRFKASAQ